MHLAMDLIVIGFGAGGKLVAGRIAPRSTPSRP
jgi:pyruvate/2-oxoglutarate dehydrogenase complex dihydrolipoamide dehydrogenase (E3) component